MISPEDILRTIDGYEQMYPEEVGYCDDLREIIAAGDATSRKTVPGHVTVGAVMVRNSAEVLLVHHRLFDKWIQPGGHLEPEDSSLTLAALRELEEEAGLKGEYGWITKATIPLEINRHPIPANPKKGEPNHDHWDFRFLVKPKGSQEPTPQEEEVKAAGWRPIDDLNNPKIVKRLIDRQQSHE